MELLSLDKLTVKVKIYSFLIETKAYFEAD